MDAAVARAINPNWMPAPDSWRWVSPDGMQQGFGGFWRRQPGHANLSWLALDMVRPPIVFDVRQHQLYMQLVVQTGPNGALAGLADLAEINSLRSFRQKLAANPSFGGRLTPLILLLADRRLHAHA